MKLLRVSDDCCDAAAVFINEFTYESNVSSFQLAFISYRSRHYKNLNWFCWWKWLLSPLYVRYEAVALIGWLLRCCGCLYWWIHLWKPCFFVSIGLNLVQKSSLQKFELMLLVKMAFVAAVHKIWSLSDNYCNAAAVFIDKFTYENHVFSFQLAFISYRNRHYKNLIWCCWWKWLFRRCT